MKEQNWEAGTYRTGSTHPPKVHRGLLALLLIPVIVVCGFIGLLAGLRIRPQRQPAREAASVEFTPQAQQITPTMGRDKPELPRMEFPQGFAGEDVSTLWQHYYGLPEGVFITSARSETGLRRGDIVLFVDGQRVTGVHALRSLLALGGPEMEIIIFRGGVQQMLTLRK